MTRRKAEWLRLVNRLDSRCAGMTRGGQDCGFTNHFPTRRRVLHLGLFVSGIGLRLHEPLSGGEGATLTRTLVGSRRRKGTVTHYGGSVLM
jgi:hypothetical protein